MSWSNLSATARMPSTPAGNVTILLYVTFSAKHEHFGCGTQIAAAEKVTPFLEAIASLIVTF